MRSEILKKVVVKSLNYIFDWLNTTTKLYSSIVFFSFPDKSAIAVAHYPSARPWWHVIDVVRRLKVLVVCQTRPDVRVRVRSIIIRIRHAAIRIRVVVATINHTAYGGTPPWGANLLNSTYIFENEIFFCLHIDKI